MLELARAVDVDDSPAAPPAPAALPSWSLPRRIRFRFAFAFVALWMMPFPIGALPFTELLARPFDLGWDALTLWSGRVFLHRTLDVAPNGSGDSTSGWLQLALLTTLALGATIVWSALDRRRLHYARLYRWLHSYLRFALATIMISYGLSKIFHQQFPFPAPTKLEQPYGDASPMGLLWTFMGFSAPYNVFTGLAETVPALLLFFRRTATLGALLLAAVMTNVVMLNFCYDVPVKIFSTELLLASLFVAGPRLGALFDMLVRERAVAAVPPAPLFGRPRLELAARIAGVVFGAWLVGHGIWTHWKRERDNGVQQVAMTGLAGTWDVVKLVCDGKEIPATLEEKTRWKTVGLSMYKGSGRLIYRQMDDFYDRVGFTHDAAKKTLTLEPEGGPKSALVYTQPDADHATLAGNFGSHAIAVELRRRPPREYRLVTRGFHWINESPYNR
jgi:hypothetical protein